MALKPFTELSLRSRREIVRTAIRHNVSIADVRSTPALSKEARRHVESEGHGSFQRIEERGHRVQQFRAGPKRGYRGTVESEEPPNIGDLRAAFNKTDTRTVMIRVGGVFDEPQLRRIGSPRARATEREEETEEDLPVRYVSAVLDRNEVRDILYGKQQRGMDVQDRIKLLLGPEYNATLVEAYEVTFANS